MVFKDLEGTVLGLPVSIYRQFLSLNLLFYKVNKATPTLRITKR